MICPFCGNEMEAGILSGDPRAGVVWKQGSKRADFIDRFVGDAYAVDAARLTLAAFTIETWYCFGCKKMIFDTELKK